MRKMLALIIAVFWISVMGCGKYVLESKIEENYIPKAEIAENYISRAEVQEKYVPKEALLKAFKGLSFKSADETNRAAAATAATDHTCRYWFMPGVYVDFCLLGCPPPPYWQDLGVPCPQ